MPTYERYGDDHEVAERVVTVADSPNDKRLRESQAWKLVEGEQAAPAPAAEATPARATAKAKPPAKEA